MNVLPEDYEGKVELDMEVLVSEEDTAVYIVLKGFETIEEADEYAEYLHENLPFLLYQSNKKH
jgi:hypothetical protein